VRAVRKTERIETGTRHSSAGITLVEATLSIAVFSLFAIPVLVTLMHGVRQSRESFEAYRAAVALRDKVAEIQDVANQPDDLVNQLGIAAIYSRYNGQSLTVPGVTS
jgi:hypothetical protein